MYRQSREDAAGSGFFALEDHQQKGIQSLDLAWDLGREPGAIREKLDRVSLILRSKEGKNIKLSARWLFDSYCGRDKLHGLNQAISRDGVGVAPGAILDAVRNPLSITGQSGGRFMMTGKDAVVIVNHQGKVITTWATNAAGVR